MIKFNCCVRRTHTKTTVHFNIMAKDRIQAAKFVEGKFPGWEYVVAEAFIQKETDA